MRVRMRRAQKKAELSSGSVCPECGAAVESHRVCSNCGMYRGRKIVSVGV